MPSREVVSAAAGAATSSLVTVQRRQLYQPTCSKKVQTTLSINPSSEVKGFSQIQASETSPFTTSSQRASVTLFQCSIPRGMSCILLMRAPGRETLI